jgi:phosphoglycolate phosphatase-like HAD superfamily hydrolase
MDKLILWDIDGTLLHTDGIASEEMRAAMRQVFGAVERRERTFYAGKTDWQIILDSFAGLSSESVAEHMEQFCAAYASLLEERSEELWERGGTMPGVVAALQGLQQHPVAQTVLTGNVAPVARLKLDVFGLLPYLNPDIGGYGNDHRERAELVRIAAERAANHYGHPFAPEHIVIVGDTPKDIACGRVHGVRTVIVATGAYSRAELLPHAPDVLLDDLRDTAAAVAAILG